MTNEFSRLSALSGRWLLSRILRFDLMLLAIVMCLITIGFITLFSAGYSFPWRIEDQIRNLIVAAGAMFATSLIPHCRALPSAVFCFSQPQWQASRLREPLAGSTSAFASSLRKS